MSEIKWTVSILLQYYEEDDYAYEIIKKAIEKQSNHEIVKYYIFKYDILRDKADILTVKIEESNPKLYIYKKIGACKDFYDDPEKYWKPFFNENAVIQNAKHNFLMTCGHGAGFGFVTNEKMPETLRFDEKQIENINYLTRIFSTGVLGFNREKIGNTLLSAFFGSKFSESGIDRLRLMKTGFAIIPLEVLSTVLVKSFNKPIDIWYARNCYMQMFESGYILRPHVKYLVGSENFVLSAGLDYEKLFFELGNNQEGDQHLKSLANNMCKNLPIKYSNEIFLKELEYRIPDFSRYAVKFISQSVNKLNEYIIVRKVIDKLAIHFLQNKTLYGLIREVRDECKDISSNPYGIIDLINFCKMLKPRTNDKTLVEILDNLISLITNRIKNVVIADYFPEEGYTKDDYAISPYGISIFFPKDKKKSANDQYIDFFMNNFYKQKDQYLNEFLNESSWPLFVIDYYEYRF